MESFNDLQFLLGCKEDGGLRKKNILPKSSKKKTFNIHNNSCTQ